MARLTKCACLKHVAFPGYWASAPSLSKRTGSRALVVRPSASTLPITLGLNYCGRYHGDNNRQCFNPTNMTAQIAEILHYGGEELVLCTEPLGDFLSLIGAEQPFEANCTALRRGYVGTWEIVQSHLYLVKLVGRLRDGMDADLASVFPDYPDRVFAHWYTGTMRIPQGRQLNYVHRGYASTYERDLLIAVNKGVVVWTKVRHNGTADLTASSDVTHRVGATPLLTGSVHPRQAT